MESDTNCVWEAYRKMLATLCDTYLANRIIDKSDVCLERFRAGLQFAQEVRDELLELMNKEDDLGKTDGWPP